MAIVNRLYFDTPDYTASYDYDDQALVLVAVHVQNRMTTTLTIEICSSADDSVLQTFSIPAQTNVDRTLNKPQQQSVTLNAQGKITNIYAKTV